MLLAQGRPDLAIAEFSKAVEIDPDFSEAHYNLGAALIQVGRPDEALEHFGLALEIDHAYADAYHGRANLFANLGRIDVRQRDYYEAVHRLSRALELRPGYQPAQERLNEARQGLKRDDQNGH